MELLSNLSQRLDNLESGLSGLSDLSQRLDNLESGLSGLSQRLDNLESGLPDLSQKLDSLESDQKVINANFQLISTDILNEKIDINSLKIDIINVKNTQKNLQYLSENVNVLNNRVLQVENKIISETLVEETIAPNSSIYSDNIIISASNKQKQVIDTIESMAVPKKKNTGLIIQRSNKITDIDFTKKG